MLVRNGPKLKEPAPPAAKPEAPLPPGPLKTDAEGYPILRAGRGMSMAILNGRARMVSSEVTMSGLASQLSSQVGRPVKDATGLTGKYDIILSWVPDSARALPPPPPGAPAPAGPPEAESGPTIFSALQEQLGLRLEQKKERSRFWWSISSRRRRRRIEASLARSRGGHRPGMGTQDLMCPPHQHVREERLGQ